MLVEASYGITILTCLSLQKFDFTSLQQCSVEVKVIITIRRQVRFQGAFIIWGEQIYLLPISVSSVRTEGRESLISFIGCILTDVPAVEGPGKQVQVGVGN